MIHDEICTYEVAKLAREKGFPQDVFGTCEMKSACYLDDGRFYKDGCICPIEKAYTAPTQSLLQRWLREEKGIHISIDRDLDFNEKDFIYEWQSSHKKELGDGCYRIITASDMEFYPTYEETLNAALKYALENLV